MRRINRAWLDGQIEDLAPMVHPEVVIVVPGYTVRAKGREEFLAGFRDFCENATIGEFREHGQYFGSTRMVSRGALPARR